VSSALLAFGGIVAVQPTLVVSGAVLAAMGVMGQRAVARSSTEADRDRTAA
jgi:hypothetical protein